MQWYENGQIKIVAPYMTQTVNPVTATQVSYYTLSDYGTGYSNGAQINVPQSRGITYNVVSVDEHCHGNAVADVWTANQVYNEWAKTYNLVKWADITIKEIPDLTYSPERCCYD